MHAHQALCVQTWKVAINVTVQLALKATRDQLDAMIWMSVLDHRVVGTQTVVTSRVVFSVYVQKGFKAMRNMSV